VKTREMFFFAVGCMQGKIATQIALPKALTASGEGAKPRKAEK
jgi:hypothetical protein